MVKNKVTALVETKTEGAFEGGGNARLGLVSQEGRYSGSCSLRLRTPSQPGSLSCLSCRRRHILVVISGRVGEEIAKSMHVFPGLPPEPPLGSTQ